MPSSGIEGHLEDHKIEQVRAEFVHLYQIEKKKLDEIIRHFRSRGICASKQQWKTQISIWGIGKNNRESDMLFAATKSRSRKRDLDKDTIFLIKGQLKDADDVERYFKRRRKVDGEEERDSNPANTPQGLFYFTPPTSPRIIGSPTIRVPPLTGPDKSRNSFEAFEASILFGDFKHMSHTFAVLCGDDATINDIDRFLLADWVSSGNTSTEIPSSLRSPDKLRAFETALSAIKDFYTGMVPEDSGRGLFQITEVNSFCTEIDTVRLQRRQGHHYTAATHWTRSVRRLPHVLRDPQGLYCARLINVIMKCVCLNDLDIAKCLLLVIGRSAVQALTNDHPFVKILRTLSLYFDCLLDCIERLMAQAAECITERPDLIDKHLYEVATVTSSLLTHRQDWTGLLTQLQSLLDPSTAHPTPSHEAMGWHTYFLRAKAVAQMELGDYKAAVRTMDEQVTDLPPGRADMHCHRVYSLRVRGEAKRRLGHTEDAMSDLQRALEMAVEYFGINHSWTLDSGRHLEQASNGSEEWHFHGR